jgi:hypothetical protein
MDELDKMRQARDLVQQVYENRPDAGKFLSLSRVSSSLLFTLNQLDESCHELMKEKQLKNVVEGIRILDGESE